jgi:hypothetical protein
MSKRKLTSSLNFSLKNQKLGLGTGRETEEISKAVETYKIPIQPSLPERLFIDLKTRNGLVRPGTELPGFYSQENEVRLLLPRTKEEIKMVSILIEPPDTSQSFFIFVWNYNLFPFIPIEQRPFKRSLIEMQKFIFNNMDLKNKELLEIKTWENINYLILQAMENYSTRRVYDYESFSTPGVTRPGAAIYIPDDKDPKEFLQEYIKRNYRRSQDIPGFSIIEAYEYIPRGGKTQRKYLSIKNKSKKSKSKKSKSKKSKSKKSKSKKSKSIKRKNKRNLK